MSYRTQGVNPHIRLSICTSVCASLRTSVGPFPPTRGARESLEGHCGPQMASDEPWWSSEGLREDKRASGSLRVPERIRLGPGKYLEGYPLPLSFPLSILPRRVTSTAPFPLFHPIFSIRQSKSLVTGGVTRGVTRGVLSGFLLVTRGAGDQRSVALRPRRRAGEKRKRKTEEKLIG